MFRYYFLRFIFVEVSARFRNDTSGYFALLEPVWLATFLAIGAMSVFPAPPIGTSFFLFFLTGILPVFTISFVSTMICRTRVFMESEKTWVAALSARVFVNCAIAFIFIQVLILGTAVVAMQPVSIEQVFAATLLILALSIGIGVFLFALVSALPIVENIWGLFTRPFILISGVFTLVPDVSDPFQGWLLLNPIAHTVIIMRAAIYPFQTGDLASPLFVMTVSVSTLLVGTSALAILFNASSVSRRIRL